MRLLLLAAWALLLTAQETKPPTIVSPEVLPDRRVVFRLWAPKAIDVQLSGDWMGPQPPVAFPKDSEGIWTATIGPLEPNIYTYGFLIEGVRAADPACRCSLTIARRWPSSKFVISGPDPLPWTERNVPKGSLHIESFFSKQLQRTSRFVVYTPADYGQALSRQYPVLVLLPGTPGDETDWTSGGGFADTMFDNLIADRKMQSAIVVMHASDVLRSGRRVEHLAQFEPMLVNELVPEVKRRYRVEQKPESWAIAGLSLGGEFAMTVGLRHPEVFRSAASLSGSIIETDFENRFGKVFAGSASITKNFRVDLVCLRVERHFLWREQGACSEAHFGRNPSHVPGV